MTSAPTIPDAEIVAAVIDPSHRLHGVTWMSLRAHARDRTLPSDPALWTALLAAAKSRTHPHHQRAWAALEAWCRPVVERFVRFRLGARGARDVPDVMQEVLVRAAAGLGSFTPTDPAETERLLRLWWFRIAQNVLINHAKSAAVRRAALDLPLEGDDGDERPLESTELWSAPGIPALFRREMAHFDPDDQALLLLFFSEDLTCAEIIEVLGPEVTRHLAPESLRKRIYRLAADMEARLRHHFAGAATPATDAEAELTRRQRGIFDTGFPLVAPPPLPPMPKPRLRERYWYMPPWRRALIGLAVLAVLSGVLAATIYIGVLIEAPR